VQQNSHHRSLNDQQQYDLLTLTLYGDCVFHTNWFSFFTHYKITTQLKWTFTFLGSCVFSFQLLLSSFVDTNPFAPPKKMFSSIHPKNCVFRLRLPTCKISNRPSYSQICRARWTVYSDKTNVLYGSPA
jgi:hypothetical protein